MNTQTDSHCLYPPLEGGDLNLTWVTVVLVIVLNTTVALVRLLNLQKE